MNFPGTEIELNDQSKLPVLTDKKKIFCAQGITQLGNVHQPVYIAKLEDYIANFGGLVANSNFALYVIRALQNGGRVWVSRVGHYTDLTNKTTLAGTKATGTITVTTNSAVFTAKAVGSGYNGFVVTTKSAKSGLSNKLDLTAVLNVTYNKQTYTLKDELFDVPTTPTTQEKTILNNKLRYIDIGTVTGAIPVGTVTLASGAQVISDIVDADYNGNADQEIGWYSFDEVTDASRIVNLDRPSPTVDAAIASYAATRNMRFHLRFPLGLTLDDMIDYRMGTGAYSQTPLNTWLGSIWGGDIIINDPANEDNQITISAIGDIAGKYCKKDQSGEWFSVANEQNRNLQTDILGLPYNVNRPSLKDLREEAYTKGINFVMKHDSLGLVLWGNNSLYQNKESILSKENVADLVLLIIRTLPSYLDVKAFNPNDPQTWLEMYNSVRPFIQQLEDGRAIIKGKGIGWDWLGDQDVRSIDDLDADKNVNKKADVSAGKYKARFKFKPISAVEFITLEVIPTDAGTDITII